MVLPNDIPLLWPNYHFTVKVLRELQEYQIITRPIILREPGKYYRIKRLITHVYQDNLSFMFVGGFSEYAWLQKIMSNVLVKHFFTYPETGNVMLPRKHLLILNREAKHAREIVNIPVLLQALKKKMPHVEVQQLIVDGKHGYFEGGTPFYHAHALLSPHGAGLNNMLFMRPGSHVIEVGFDDENFRMPEAYYCLARSIGLHYSLSIANGSYRTKLQANVDDLVELLQRAFA